MARRLIVVLTIAAAGAATFPAGAEAGHEKVLCGNFGGQGMDPHQTRRPARCDVTRIGNSPAFVVRLRSMEWTRWSTPARGRGLVNGRQRTVRLKRARQCGPLRYVGPNKVYTRIKVDNGPWRPILYCGD